MQTFKDITLDELLDFYLKDRPEFIVWRMRLKGLRITHRAVDLETEDAIQFRSDLQSFLDLFPIKVIERGYKVAKTDVEVGSQRSIITCKVAIDETTYHKYAKEEQEMFKDPRTISPHKDGYYWIGNSGQSTAEEAIQSYVVAFNYQQSDLIAESFSPESGILFAVYKRLSKEGD